MNNDQQIFSSFYLPQNITNFEYNYRYNQILTNHYSYEGSICNGEFNGYGQINYEADGIFIGLFKNSHPNGLGIRTYMNGDEDIGEWHNSKLTKIHWKDDLSPISRLRKSSIQNFNEFSVSKEFFSNKGVDLIDLFKLTPHQDSAFYNHCKISVILSRVLTFLNVYVNFFK